MSQTNFFEFIEINFFEMVRMKDRHAEERVTSDGYERSKNMYKPGSCYEEEVEVSIHSSEITGGMNLESENSIPAAREELTLNCLAI